MATFLKRQTDFISKDDRPQLLISRGTIIAWIPDPFKLPKSFANYMDEGDTPLVAVRPGMAMMAFPPRLECSFRRKFSFTCPPDPGTDRGRDPNYVLVLTADGFWGVLDRTQSAAVLDEKDLIPMAQAERAAKAEFYVAKRQIVNVPYAAGETNKYFLPLGQVLRAADASACTNSKEGQLCVNFDIKSPTFESSRNQLAKTASAARVKPFDALQVPEEQIRPVKLLDTIVPNTAADAWFGGTGGYEDILMRGAFNSLRLADREPKTAQCGTEWFSVTALDESVKGEFEAKARAGIGVSGTSAEIAAKVAAAVKAMTEKTEKTTITLAIEPLLWPIDLTDKNGEASSFWVGRAKTCSSGEQTVATIMVSNLPPILEANATFLQTNFRQVAESIMKSETDKQAVESQLTNLKTQLDPLKAVKPGGNPFDPSSGVTTFKCLSQALAFDDKVVELMNSLTPVQVRAAITLTSGKRNSDSSATKRFYRDAACGS